MSGSSYNCRIALYTVISYTVIFVAFHGTIADLFTRWTRWDQSQSHGLIIVAIAFYLYYQRFRTAVVAQRVNFIAPAGIVLISFFWAVSAAISIDILEQLCLLLVLLLTQFCLVESGYRKRVLGPVLFLLFAIPVWDHLNPYLVALSSFVVTGLVQRSDLTAYIDGSSIFLPFGTIVIADGCSGVRYLTVALALASYLVLTSRITAKKIGLLFLLSTGLGLLVNWIRIYALIWIAYATQMQSELIEDHETFGWGLFIIVLVPLVIAARRLEIYPRSETAAAKNIPSLPVFAVTVGSAIIGPLLLLAVSSNLSDPGIDRDSITARLEADGSKSSGIGLKTKPPPAWKLPYEFHTGEVDIRMETGFYWQEQTGDSLVPYLAAVVSPEVWRVASSAEELLAHDVKATAQVVIEKRSGRRKYVLYWFRIGNFSTGNYKLAKLYQLPAVLQGINILEFTVLEADCSDETCRPESTLVMNKAAELISLFNKAID